ncbi:hypothetical protein BMJ32_00615 [Sinorhizobium medicae]|uniref:Uncharacterized protein n=1 Tax=Sinorhizobium medicae TaxID=110321 RepID=A0ABX4TNY5_9HYPH|nr:hypothetical protein BMJ34_23400 [Sinorhizobium medicae]PLT94017.1 hypothetical protein BMJ35_00725 [Sinorhizobium medicae]PLU04272.1 hypothetical protein BMJ33_12350 [Sinorhizobium medicae]PLU08095.1 hypothetical protein BMJ32_00615 [Sinorhizobium medicae]PLU19736.1 hypothetical protein BMJ30_10325 [Sinorhizobium medicae]
MMHSEKINEIVTHFVVPKNYDPGILYEVGAHDIACFDAADHSPLSLHRPMIRPPRRRQNGSMSHKGL